MNKTTVIDLYNEYKTIESQVEEINKKDREKYSTEKLEEYKQKGDVDSIKEVIVGSRVDNMHYNLFKSIAMSRFYFVTEMYLRSESDLPEDVKTLYNKKKSEMKNSEIFAINNKGELVEREKGILKERREEFLNSEDFKITLKNIEKAVQMQK